jgi:hypothetical protein
MADVQKKPPHNRDQELPPRKRESIESTLENERGKERDRSAPLAEEETYQREPRNQRPRSQRDGRD